VYSDGGLVVRVVHQGDQEVPPETDVIDAKGGSLYAGLVDSHCHPFEYGWLKRSVDLRGTSNVTGVRLRLSAGIRRAKPGEWGRGVGWDQEEFPGRAMPRRQDIDDISPENPVVLARVCGHVALLNSLAILQLNLSERRGIEYERDQTGSLTGVIKEGAIDDVYASVPRSEERSAADLQSLEAEAARLGLTAMHCIVSPEGYREELGALAALEASGSLSLRYRVYIPPDAVGFVEAKGLKAKLNGKKARINGVKIYADGSLGARTAALREPYSDDPENSGLLRHTDEELCELVERVDAAGYQAIIHAIGDRAIEQATQALSRVTGTKNPNGHRIEHASLLPKDLRGKMVKSGIRATVQPLFITSDTWAADRLGEERVRDLYPLKSILDDGIVASGSSDSPVEALSPILGMWASMTRTGYAPEQALDLDEASSLYTSNAESNGLDDFRLSISEGSSANFTVFDSDTRGMHPALFRKVGVLATVVEGTVVHSYGQG